MYSHFLKGIFFTGSAFFLLCFGECFAWEFSGNAKYGYSSIKYPKHSTLSGIEQKYDFHNATMRLQAVKYLDRITATAHFQTQYLKTTNRNSSLYSDIDRYRFFDLALETTDTNNEQIIHRFDRFNISYAGDDLVFKLGRQAVSWGNGIVFHAMDIFNPFRPTEIDKDYKPGDDMLYCQYLTPSGNDWQMILLPRRNTEEQIHYNSSSVAFKYHGLYEFGDVDFLLASHYEDIVVGIGYLRSIFDLLWRLDFTLTRIDDDEYKSSFLTNIDYSWTWFSTNFYGFIEYYYNGYGSSDTKQVDASELDKRINRAELFVKDEQYFSTGAMIELHPLVTLNPLVILNLHDFSGLTNISLQYDFQDNLLVKLNVVVPFGEIYSEFNGEQTPGTNINFLASYYF